MNLVRKPGKQPRKTYENKVHFKEGKEVAVKLT